MAAKNWEEKGLCIKNSKTFNWKRQKILFWTKKKTKAKTCSKNDEIFITEQYFMKTLHNLT